MIIQGNDPYTQPSFSLGNRILRTIWNLTWAVLFLPSPRPFHAWRALLLRLFGAKLGTSVHVYPSTRVWAPWQLQVGDRVGIGNGANIYNMAPINIGDGCVISQGAHLCAGSHDIDSPNFQLIAAPISLGRNVWVCAEAFIGPGVKIADGCVLGARGVLTKSIDPPWTVWAGNPAKMIRHRAKGR
jgi:putative colanic acid biosynthesis acetyltransferase WcaF